MVARAGFLNDDSRVRKDQRVEPRVVKSVVRNRGADLDSDLDSKK